MRRFLFQAITMAGMLRLARNVGTAIAVVVIFLALLLWRLKVYVNGPDHRREQPATA